jgi:hypothetical protein
MVSGEKDLYPRIRVICKFFIRVIRVICGCFFGRGCTAAPSSSHSNPLEFLHAAKILSDSSIARSPKGGNAECAEDLERP